ncbi:MAG: hypothetical protein ACPGYM_01485 [Flavobacteriales bacterium]
MTQLRWIVFGVLLSFALQAEAKHFIHIQEDVPADQKTALLILNGFGGTRKGCKAQMAFWANCGMDVFIPDVLLRSSLTESSEALEAFVEARHLEAYREVKAICYIAGAYLLHTQLEAHPMANLTRIVYDRSPTQERAPQTAMERIPKLGMLKLGKVLRDLSVATWPEVPESDRLKKGLAIENRATPLMRFLQDEAKAMGPLVYDWQTIDPTAHDAFHVALDHDMMYVRWDVLGEPFLHFFEHGVFPAELPRNRIHNRPFDPKYPLPE